MLLHDSLHDFTNQCDGMPNRGWEWAKYLPPQKLYCKTNAAQHVQVNQFAKTNDICVARSSHLACQTTPITFHSKFILLHVADYDWQLIHFFGMNLACESVKETKYK
jgi:hypothetical protein